MNRKLELLQLINDKRDILFTEPGAKKPINKEVEKAWNEVLHKAQHLKLAGPQRKWTFVRDSIFKEWKEKAISKYKEEEVDNKLDEVDNYILDNFCEKTINKSPSRESYHDIEMTSIRENNLNRRSNKKINIAIIEEEQEEENDEPSFNINVGKEKQLNTSILSNKRRSLPVTTYITPTLTNEYDPFKRRSIRETTSTSFLDNYDNKYMQPAEKRVKIDHHYDDYDDKDLEAEEKKLKIELLKHDIYHRKLQCLALEKQLKLPSSVITEPLFEQ